MLTKKLYTVKARWLYDVEGTVTNRMICRAFADVGVYKGEKEVSCQQLATSSITFENRDKFLDAAMQAFKELKALLQAFDVSTLRFNDLALAWKQEYWCEPAATIQAGNIAKHIDDTILEKLLSGGV